MKTETYTCQHCGIDVTRPVARGQRPKWCADCRAKSVWQHNTGSCIRCAAPLKTGSKWCSRECARLDNPAKPRPARTPREPRPKWCAVFFTVCRVCEATFCSRYTVSTCSAECAETKRLADRRETKQRERARKRGAFIAPVFRTKIYKRDGWRCQICGRKVKRTAAPHPLSPTLDHIVPLALGGTHEPSNVRLAHYLCNSRRGAAEDGPQLALFG